MTSKLGGRNAQCKYVVATSVDGKIAREDGSFDCFDVVGDEHVPDYLASIQ